jgi:hypothetical protein
LMTCFLEPELRTFDGTICGSIFATRLRMKGAALEDIVESSGTREFDDDEAAGASGGRTSCTRSCLC